MRSIVALITDFGTRDWYVGSMKGVMLGIDPEIAIVDITHEVAASDIRAGAFALACSLGSFAEGTIFVAVVDPGVGGARQALVARAGGYFFVGPDNGVLSLALERLPEARAHAIQNPKYQLRQVSATFHGRDVFAPVAAHLAKLRDLKTFGPEVRDWTRLGWPAPALKQGAIEGEVVYIDRFGNLITSIDEPALSTLLRPAERVRCVSGRAIPVRRFYQEAATGEPLALIGSSGFLEISLNMGDAASALGMKVGDAVRVE